MQCSSTVTTDRGRGWGGAREDERERGIEKEREKNTEREKTAREYNNKNATKFHQ